MQIFSLLIDDVKVVGWLELTCCISILTSCGNCCLTFGVKSDSSCRHFDVKIQNVGKLISCRCVFDANSQQGSPSNESSARVAINTLKLPRSWDDVSQIEPHQITSQLPFPEEEDAVGI